MLVIAGLDILLHATTETLRAVLVTAGLKLILHATTKTLKAVLVVAGLKVVLYATTGLKIVLYAVTFRAVLVTAGLEVLLHAKTLVEVLVTAVLKVVLHAAAKTQAAGLASRDKVCLCEVALCLSREKVVGLHPGDVHRHYTQSRHYRYRETPKPKRS